MFPQSPGKRLFRHGRVFDMTLNREINRMWHNLLLILCFAALIVPAQAREWYVATTGTDSSASNSGLIATPFQHIWYATSLANPGDDIVLRGGQYHESFYPKGGTAAAWITYRSYTNERATIHATDFQACGVYGASYLALKWIDFTHDDNSGVGLLCQNSANGVPSFHLFIQGCNAYRNGMCGYQFIGSDYVTLTNSNIYNNCNTGQFYNGETLHGSGISLYKMVNSDGTGGTHNQITRCSVWGNIETTAPGGHSDGNGIIVDTCLDTNGAYTEVSNNTCHDNGARGIHAFMSGSVSIHDNVCYHDFQDPTIPVIGETTAIGVPMAAAFWIYFANNTDDQGQQLQPYVSYANHIFWNGSQVPGT